MNDREIVLILVYVKIVVFSCVSFGSILYAFPLCFIRRFHTPIHLLSYNVSVALFICATFCVIYFIMNTFDVNILWTEKSCLLILYLQTTANSEFISALCVASLNRLFAVVYQNKLLFRTKRWAIICVTIQWIYGALIPLPLFGSSLQHCFESGLELSYRIYVLFINAIFSSIFLAIINSIIFSFVRRSTRRVRATNSGSNAPARVLNQRDAHLLKHMIFMFAAFFCGWVPIYIIGVIDWNGNGISYIAFHACLTLPMMSYVIDLLDLYLYNHELRTFIKNKLRNRSNQ